jgi:hypothetical protein
MRSSIILCYLFALVFSGYNYYSIRGLTGGLEWHLLQYVSVILAVAVGYALRKYHEKDKTWHNFGKLAAWSSLSILIYVYSLHFFLSR